MTLFIIDAIEDGFPPIDEAEEEPNGLLAVGGDLSPERLLLAYRSGIFPWMSHEDHILWWSPSPRCVFYPSTFKPSRSLNKKLRQGVFSFSVDRCFTRVMHACAAPRSYADSTWIEAEFIENYTKLHHAGHAHSIEVWNAKNELVGGLYGINIGLLFFGESMFSTETDASKAALAYLMQLCKHWQIPVVDAQVENPHLMSMGAELISRQVFKVWLHALTPLSPPDWQQAPAFNAL